MKINRASNAPGPNKIIGEIDRSLVRFCRVDLPKLGKRQDGGNFMRAQTNMMWAWSDALGDIIP